MVRTPSGPTVRRVGPLCFYACLNTQALRVSWRDLGEPRERFIAEFALGF